MGVNLDKPQLWFADISQSVAMYNDWFMRFAPNAVAEARKEAQGQVEATFQVTNDLTDLSVATLKKFPGILPTLRMATCPPIAVDRLVGLGNIDKNLVSCMERDRLPLRMKAEQLNDNLQKISDIITLMLDRDIFPWLARDNKNPRLSESRIATAVISDRLCMAMANPAIRNAQERRQLRAIKDWLEARQYRQIEMGDSTHWQEMEPGTFSFRMNVPVEIDQKTHKMINIPVDAVIMPSRSNKGDLPMLIEAKSAGDFTNTNKRRKEEAVKMGQLRHTYGDTVQFNLFLCGYFGEGYLGYEASEDIDWVWEHRIDDLQGFGL